MGTASPCSPSSHHRTERPALACKQGEFGTHLAAQYCTDVPPDQAQCPVRGSKEAQIGGAMPKRADSPAVLVVDDDPDTRETLEWILEEAGYTVLTASNGMVALAVLHTHLSPLVVVLDWLMPGLDGMAVLRAMATEAPEAQRHVYLLLTAMRDAARPLVAALPADLAVTLVGKPFNVDDLLALVARAATHLGEQGREQD
jgi:CheY-like chemotaxis protein